MLMVSETSVIDVEHQMSNLSTIPWREQVTFWWYNDGVCLLLDQYA
jgi:hypothetical protein